MAMGRKSTKLLVMAAWVMLLTSCAGDFSPQHALNTIAGQTEFENSFCAPLHIGREVLTAEAHKSPNEYIMNKYGNLVKAGLIKVDVGEKNSWRTVINVTLTEGGRAMVNHTRTDKHFEATGEDHVFYVAVCDLVPEKAATVDTVSIDTVGLNYTIIERNITPFGSFLGFVDGRSHNHKRLFVRKTFSWDLLPVDQTLHGKL